MESIQVISLEEFFKIHKKVTREVIKEELQKTHSQNKEEEILKIEDLCRLLGKTPQTIFSWLDKNIISGHYLNGSLYFKRSEILALLEKGKNKSKRKSNTIEEQ